jgi:hypothetical protein
VRANRNTDTPVPPDEPMGQNPPDGAIVDYWLPEAPRGAVTLDVLDASGALVRRFASTDPAPELPTGLQVPLYWMRPPRTLPAAAGMNRFVWDLHGAALPGVEQDYPISATPGDTPAEPRGPWVLPGEYRLRLSVGIVHVERALSVRMDPRITTPAPDLRRQSELSAQLVAGMRRDSTLRSHLRVRIATIRDTADTSRRALVALMEGERAAPRGRDIGGPPSLARTQSQLIRLFDLVQEPDAAPTPAVEAAAAAALAELGELERRCDQALGRPVPGR